MRDKPSTHPRRACEQMRQCARCQHPFLCFRWHATYCSTRCRTAALRDRRKLAAASGKPAPKPKD